jgi:hypothetical protein
LLRDEPSSPCTRHGRRRVTWHRQTLRSDNASYCSGARPSAQPTSLARQDRNRFRSLQGRVTTATPVPGNWTSCMTGRPVGMKAHVSTMLTESDLSIALRVRDFKCLVRRNAGCKPTSTAFRVFSVLTMRGIETSRRTTIMRGHTIGCGTLTPHEFVHKGHVNPIQEDSVSSP